MPYLLRITLIALALLGTVSCTSKPIQNPDTPAVWLIDIWQHEVARQVATTGRPLDLCSSSGSVYVLLDTPGWLRLSPCDPPLALAWPAGLGPADRLDVGADGAAFVLTGAGSAAAAVVSLQDTTVRLALPFCTDFLIVDEGDAGARCVLARRPGETFAQWRLAGRHFSPLGALHAPQYDGGGIALAPDGRIAYWSARGITAGLRGTGRKLQGLQPAARSDSTGLGQRAHALEGWQRPGDIDDLHLP